MILKCCFAAAVAENILVFSFLEKTKLFYVYLNKKQSIDFKKLEKLSTLEPKVIMPNRSWNSNVSGHQNQMFLIGTQYFIENNSTRF